MKPPNEGWNRVGLMILLVVFSLLCLVFAPDAQAAPPAHNRPALAGLHGAAPTAWQHAIAPPARQRAQPPPQDTLTFMMRGSAPGPGRPSPKENGAP